jgi:hypothetical protein
VLSWLASLRIGVKQHDSDQNQEIPPLINNPKSCEEIAGSRKQTGWSPGNQQSGMVSVFSLTPSEIITGVDPK